MAAAPSVEQPIRP